MARKILVQREDGTWPVLTETSADNEAQLQEIMKDNPDLLPIDEFGMTGPLLVVGRETALPSGYVDLLCVARGGEVLIVEFKTGPQNADFRHVLAQLLDYGSDLWRLTYDEFESLVPLAFFSGPHCHDPRLQGQPSLEAATRAIWPDMTDEEVALFRESIARQLAGGGFHYVAVAQRFTTTMERTVEYLNATMPAARFYAVELVRFAAGSISAFESRTVLKPSAQTGGTKQVATTTEALFLEAIGDDAYREALRQFLDACRALKLRFEWGVKGASIRVRTADRQEPLTIAWLFPPGVSGWSGLTNLTLGYDPASAAQTPSAQPALQEYLSSVAELAGVGPVKPQGLKGYQLDQSAVLANHHLLPGILTTLVQQINKQA